MCVSFQSSSQSQLIKQTIESKSRRVTIPSTQLHPGTVYIFTLTVHKMGRTPMSVNQTVSITTSVWTQIVENGINCCLWWVQLDSRLYHTHFNVKQSLISGVQINISLVSDHTILRELKLVLSERKLKVYIASFVLLCYTVCVCVCVLLGGQLLSESTQFNTNSGYHNKFSQPSTIMYITFAFFFR